LPDEAWQRAFVSFSNGTDAINHEKSCYLSFEIKSLKKYFNSCEE
jgi:hypothetical protein